MQKNKHLLYMLHDIEECLRSTPSLSDCELLYDADLNRREKGILDTAQKKGIRPRQLSRDDFRQLVLSYHGALPNGLRHILLLVSATRFSSQNRLSDLWSLLKKRENPIVLILAGINDPHNLGAIIRSADLFEAAAIILPKRRSAALNDTVRRVSAGASHHVPLFTVANLVRIIEELKEKHFWIYGAGLGGRKLTEITFTGPVAFIMGNEEKGIPHEVRKHLDELLSIPTGGHIDSCNVSVAAGIFLYEAKRQNAFSYYSGSASSGGNSSGSSSGGSSGGGSSGGLFRDLK